MSEPWTPKDQPQPADVVVNITGESADVWIFGGVKFGAFADANDAFVVRDALNQNAEQWLAAHGFTTPENMYGVLTPAPADAEGGEEERHDHTLGHPARGKS